MYYLNLGFDFGSSRTKVVIRDKSRDRTFPVPFHNNQFTIPTRLFTNGEEYSIIQSRYFNQELSSIKKQLYDGKGESLLHATAFISIILKNSIYWFFNENEETADYYNVGQIHEYEPLAFNNLSTEHSVDYNTINEIHWESNIGVPSKNRSSKEHQQERFRLALRAAWVLLASFIEPTKTNIRKVLELVTSDRDYGMSDEYTNAIPEIVAQLADYVRSGQRQNGIHCLIDVGAMTIDVAIMNIAIDIDTNEVKHSIFASEVNFDYAVYSLVKEVLKFNDAELLLWLNNHGGVGCNMPNKIRQISITSLDEASPFMQELYGTLVRCATILKKNDPIYTGLWNKKGIPFFLTGGGKEINLYKHLDKIVNPRVEPIGAVGYIPIKIRHDNMSSDISVAIGLSWSIDDLGIIKEFSTPPDCLHKMEHKQLGSNVYDKDSS